MREAIGGTWLVQIVIVFVLLFTGYMCLYINRSKAFNVKDQIIQTIQTYNGIDMGSSYEEGDDDALAEIIEYISANAYRVTGSSNYTTSSGSTTTCWDRHGNRSDDGGVFCITRVDVSEDAPGEFSELPEMYYYHVEVFYQLDLPIFSSLFNFRVVGDTKIMYGSAS